jgi:O-antigen/teichoic acid export membrane protein
MGLQEGFAANIWRCLGSVLGLVAVLVVIVLQGGLIWLVLGSLGGPIVAYVINTVHFFWVGKPDLSPRREFVSREMIGRIAKIGFLFFGLQIAMALTFASDNVVIAQMLGAEAVTQYAVPEKLFNLVGLVVGMVLFPLWPAYGEAIARGDRAWVRSTHFRSVFWSCAVTTVLSAFLVIFGQRIIELWAGSMVHPTLMLLLGLGVWKVVEVSGNAVSMLLNGANVVRFQLILASITAVLAIVLKVLLVGHIGLAGVVWATVIAHLATIPPTVWYVQRWLEK